MKSVISGDELQQIMSEAVNLLCDTVSSTLGPTGNNILINNSDTTPFITNDGVTIATNIDSEDKRINTVLEIVKEASLKTNELVGDGTTTTLVLLQSIFNLGLEEIKNGKNKIILKNELLSYMDKVVNEINNLKRNPREEELLSISITSSNSYEIGKIITDIFKKVKSKYSIKLEESNSDLTYSTNKKGYNISIKNISNLYFTKDKCIKLKNVKILILKGYLDSLESISDIINSSFENNDNLIIITEAMSDEIRNEVLVYYLNNKNIFVLEQDEYASHRDKQEEDISFLTNANIKNIDYEEAYTTDLGRADNIIINSNEIIFLNSNNCIGLINKLNNELDICNSDYEKEFINNRISKLEKGITTIYVGGTTKTEKRERMMRFEDAICALETAKNGITIGEGITYLKASEILTDDNISSLIIKKSLHKPFERIMDNLGLNSNEIKNKIINNNYNVIYDYRLDDYISVNKSNIIDSSDVVINAFKNALSIAAILLSTSSLVINLNEKQVNNIM